MRQELLSAKDRQGNLRRLLKDSVVKKRLYHGTTAHDEYADEEGQAFKQFTGRPTWLAEEPYTASGYSKGTGSTYPVYAQLKNPLKLNFDANDDAEKAFPLARKLGVDINHIMTTQKPEKAWEVINHPSFIDAVENAGYDGISMNEGGYKTHGVLDPRKIKSATGNRGTYDPNDPDITKADGGVINLAKGGSVNIGINVATDRKAGRRYADLIVDGHKSLESRNSDSLRPYVGKRVAIVRTGEGPAKAIGEVTIGEPMVVNKKKFRALEDQHLVPEGSSFDINTPTKHLYPMHDPVRYDDERDVGHGIIARKLKMADGGKVNIENTNGALDRALAAARKEQAYREMEEYLKARGAVPDIKVGFLPSQTAAEFQRTILPVGTGTIKVNRNRLANQAQEALPATLMHELAHAVDRQISQQAAEQAGVPNQFTEAYAKLVGSGEQRRADIARKLDPEWEKRNRLYRPSPRELAGHGMGAFVDNTAQAPGPRHVDATAATELAILMDLANRNTDKKPKGLEKIPAFLRGIGYANGGTVNQGGTMPTLAEMRAMLMKRGNPIELQSIGVNEAPGLSPKAYMPPDRAESFQPAPGGVATQSGMPIGGIDQSRMMPGQQLMPQQPGQAPGTSEQPGRSATGQPQGNQPGQQPSPPPTGFGPMGSMEAQPSAPPSGLPSNILSMTPQGRALNAIGPAQKPQNMATGGGVKQQGVTMGSPKSTRMVFQAEGSGGVKGINVPRHMWEGSSGVFQKGTRAGQEFKTPGMKDVNAMRAKVYGSENRDPLTIGQIGRIHKDTLAEHFKKPIEDQVKDEKDALGRLREAGHIGKTANTLDESEKLDTVRHEHDEEGRTHVGYASKGVAGHALYTSGHGKNMKHHVINTCPGQTEGCGGGKDAKGIVDTTKGTCFAPVAEAQYPGAAIRRASHEQAKHDPAMTRDWILAHTGSIRDAANAADKKNQRMLFRPNVVDETDTSSRHVIRHLNEQRKQEDKPGIIANSYGKTNELHDPENGYYVTHSNVGPKVKQGREISENIGRDRQRVSNTIMAANAKGVDFSNEQGNKTPPKGSYMVTNVKRGSPLSKKMQEHITHAKYWSTGRDENELSDEEKKEGPEGHYGPSGRKTTPEKAHYGHTTLNGRRYDYQKQHILHPRLVQVGENKDGTPHMIPTDSRFKDTEFLPKDRFKTKNGKEAGHILMTTPTESTSNLGHETSFTHHVDDKSIKHAMSNNGEYEIDKPEDQEKARGKEYAAPQPISIVKKADGGSIESRHPGLSDDDFHAFPERNFAAQRHLAMRRGDDEARAERPRHAVVVHKNTNTMRHEMMTRRKG